MRKSKSKIVLWAAFVLVFFLLLYGFRFEDFQALYSSFPDEDDEFGIIKAREIGQGFELKYDSVCFNGISLAVFNPTGKDVSCTFTLKTQRESRVIRRAEVIVDKETDRFNVETVSFPTVQLDTRQRFYFELRGASPFFFVESTKENVDGNFPAYINEKRSDRLVLFRIEHREKHSILSHLFKPDKGRSNVTLLMLILGSLAFLCSAGWLAFRSFSSPPPVKNDEISHPRMVRSHVLIITFLALYLFFFLSTAFVIQNNTHARLLGAEDDAYITYRYAMNITEGRGFCFNEKESILGTTTPFYTLLLSLFGFLTKNIPIISLLLNLASILSSGIIVYLLFLKWLPRSIALASGILFIFFPVFYRIFGMETNFVIFLTLLALYLFQEGKYGFAFFTLGIATLTRMEVFLLVLFLILSLLWKKDYKQLARVFLVYLVTVIPWFIFSYGYFGSVVPNTFYIKTGGTYAESGILPKIHHLFSETLDLRFAKSVFLQSFTDYLTDYIQYYIFWVGLFFVCFFIAVKYIFKIRFLRIYLLWALAFVFAMSVLNVSPYIWYYGIPLSFVPLVIAGGFNGISSFLKKHLGRIKASYVLGFLLLAFFVFELVSIHSLLFSQWYSRHTGHLERYETYHQISDYIHEHIPQEKTIAMEEIGIVGYRIKNKIWDLHLLVHDARQFPNPYYVTEPERYPYFLSLMNPDYIILNSGRWFQSPFYRQNYRPIKLFPVSEYPWDPIFYYLLAEIIIRDCP